MIKNKLDQVEVHDLIKEAVDIELEFIIDSIPCNMLGMNSELMQEYIKFVADRLVVQLGYEKIYNAKNPFPFMDRINLEHKTNFFENRESNYSKAKVGQTVLM
jgi:ribonucleotide reductase beta subunit family protein with ferritin-like domain